MKTISTGFVTAIVITAMGVTMSAAPASAKTCKSAGYQAHASDYDIAFAKVRAKRRWMGIVAHNVGGRWTNLDIARHVKYTCQTNLDYPDHTLCKLFATPCVLDTFDTRKSGQLPIIRPPKIEHLP